ncbi:MAG: class I SAM-dependent RNA methyltransferase, partial [Pseudomonadota bacterium]
RPGETVVDPMCGSGTFVLEAADRTAGLLPGRVRDFAFEKLASFDAEAWGEMRRFDPVEGALMGYGSDRDQGAVQRATANAERAGLQSLCRFRTAPVSEAAPPGDTPGLLIVNPPYGARIGNKKLLYGLYAALGETIRRRFSGWRVGLITSEAGLARATGLDFAPPGPFVDHGGVKIRLYQTEQ